MQKIGLIVFIFFVTINLSAQTITVAKDGSGNFVTLQSALDAIPIGNKATSIFIKNGTYKEVIVIDVRKSFITLIGEDKEKTILSFDNHAGTKLPNGDTLNTWTCASTFIYEIGRAHV